MEKFFNPKPGTILHLDLNSCFASIEQQANPFLRGKPVAVAAYDSPNGCILAASVDAKKLGIKTGMRVKDGKAIYPNLIILTSDPNKYRSVHLQFKKLLSDYGNPVPKSIDEFVMEMDSPQKYAPEIKKRIKTEIGDYLTVSVGIAPNRYLAKVAAGLHKPDGLDEINAANYVEIYSKLKLMNLTGIKEGNAARLTSAGIFTVLDFYNATAEKLQRAFHSIIGHDWFLRLHGFEADDEILGRRSYGNSFSLPKPYSTLAELAPILVKLTEKTGFRMRRAGYYARGVHVSLLFRDWSYWHHGEKTPQIFDSRDIYRIAFTILKSCPNIKPVHTLAVSCFNLEQDRQLEFFDDRKEELVKAMDKINERWGSFVITPALMLGTRNFVSDRIAFGGVKELEEILNDQTSAIA